MWKCLLCQDHIKGVATQTSEALLEELRRLRSSMGMWIVLLFRGGHFAAAVFKPRSVAARAANKAQAVEVFETVAHKTFHRYVVR